MKLLYLDIECSPNLADVWALWNQNISISQLRVASRVICFAASWQHEDTIKWYGEYETDREEMIDAAWQLLDQADVVCTYNGKRYDIPTLNKEFLLADFPPPSPFQQLDLLEVMRKRFRFPSNQLEYIAGVLGTEGKIKHSGHELWIRCLQRDPTAWQVMAEYNKRDVSVLKEIHPKILPWIGNHPAVPLYQPDPEGQSCPYCGASAENLTKQGFAYTKTAKYQRYRCNACGGWSQEGKRLQAINFRSVI